MAISKKENEIVELKERIEDLDNFIEFGQALVAKGEDKPRAVAPAHQAPAEAASPETQADDDWGKTENETKPAGNGIARVLSQRAG